MKRYVHSGIFIAFLICSSPLLGNGNSTRPNSCPQGDYSLKRKPGSKSVAQMIGSPAGIRPDPGKPSRRAGDPASWAVGSSSARSGQMLGQTTREGPSGGRKAWDGRTFWLTRPFCSRERFHAAISRNKQSTRKDCCGLCPRRLCLSPDSATYWLCDLG